MIVRADHGFTAHLHCRCATRRSASHRAIDITSTSEIALVAVSCLPSGLQEKYAAADTTPPDRSCLPSVLRLRQAPICQP